MKRQKELRNKLYKDDLSDDEYGDGNHDFIMKMWRKALFLAEKQKISELKKLVEDELILRKI